jgi:multidrug efflux pump subunit AcrB
MPRFFIDRPIFAWVIALFILVFGGVAITQLPIAQYPTVAPPSVVISATYPGASAKTLDESVISVIEQELNGAPGLAYIESVSQANGTGQITVTFETGTNIDLAQVDLQNRLARATPRLPAAVTQQGVKVDKSRSNVLMFVMLSSTNPAYDPVALGDYASRNVIPELQRVKGIGQVNLFGTEKAMRVWVDPAKLVSFGLNVSDVNAAIRAQNALVPAGALGDRPNLIDQTMTATVVVNGQLESVEQFGNIVLRAKTDGATVRLKDVARLELGAQTYGTYARLNGKPALGMSVQLSPTGNALESAKLVKARMVELQKYFPQGVSYSFPYDTSGFIEVSISPMAFFAGSVGNIYRQFSLSMVASMLFSAFLALSLTPALCATLLKPVPADHHEKGGFFGWFNRFFNSTTHGYEGVAAKLVRRGGRVLIIYVLIVAVVGWMYVRMPSAFLPSEDQGNLLVNVQLPPGATAPRTEAVISQVEQFFIKQPEVQSVVGVVGFSFAGTGQNAALAFVTLKDFKDRQGAEHSSQALAKRAFGALMGVRDAFIFPLNPPPIRELGNATGFSVRLQDRGGLGHEALLGARNQMLGMLAQSKIVTGVRPDGLEDAPQLQLDIDRDKAYALGVSFDALSSTLSTALGSAYVNDFPNRARLQRVVVQADAAARMQPEQLLQLNVNNTAGQSVPLSTFVKARWVTGQMQAVRYNGYPAMRLAGDAAAGFSTGQAMEEVAAIAAKLPPGIGIEWTGLSREEQLSGSQATSLLVFSLLAVFLCLAALYESWTIPVAVLLVVPLGILGSLLGANLRDMPNDVFFKVGLITIIGLSAKNAILIIEFARELQQKGMGVMDAILQACHLRFRPIIMTSLAFILGVLPLVLANGAGAASQRAIGTGVMSGMIAATVLAVFFVPVFYVVVRRFFPGRPPRALESSTAATASNTASSADHSGAH